MVSTTLERELETYREKLTELSANEGKFVLIHGSTVEGTFDTYQDALTAGYERFSCMAHECRRAPLVCLEAAGCVLSRCCTLLRQLSP